MGKVFDKVMRGANDPQKHNPYHRENEARDKKKEYNALTEPTKARTKEED